MNEAIPPWSWPAVRHAGGGGDRRRSANQWKRWDGKAAGLRRREIPAMSAGLRLSKPRETVGRKAIFGA